MGCFSCCEKSQGTQSLAARLFDFMDADRNGYVTMFEVKRMGLITGVPMMKEFHDADTNLDEMMTKQEFVSSCDRAVAKYGRAEVQKNLEYCLDIFECEANAKL